MRSGNLYLVGSGSVPRSSREAPAMLDHLGERTVGLQRHILGGGTSKPRAVKSRGAGEQELLRRWTVGPTLATGCCFHCLHRLFMLLFLRFFILLSILISFVLHHLFLLRFRLQQAAVGAPYDVAEGVFPESDRSWGRVASLPQAAVITAGCRIDEAPSLAWAEESRVVQDVR